MIGESEFKKFEVLPFNVRFLYFQDKGFTIKH